MESSYDITKVKVNNQDLTTNVVSKGFKKCRRCGKNSHHENKCYFANKNCYTCKQLGHSSRMCKQKKINCMEAQEDSTQSNVNTLYNEDNINMIDYCPPFFARVNFKNLVIRMEIDTGAAASIIDYDTFNKTDLKLRKCVEVFKAFNGSHIPILGKCVVNIANTDIEFEGELFVTKVAVRPVMGRSWLNHIINRWPPKKVSLFVQDHSTESRKIQSIQTQSQVENENDANLEELLNRYHDVFDGKLGCLKNYKAEFKVKPDVNPKFCKPRLLSLFKKKMVEEELLQLEEEGIIESVKYSKWASPIVPVVKKSGKLRICGDYSVAVNGAIERYEYPLPRIEEILTSLCGGERFSTIDLEKAYNQMLIDDKYMEFFTINTHVGLKRFKRLSFGINSAPGLWQKAMDHIFGSLPGIKCYLDDIIVTGKNDQEHLKNLDVALRLLQKHGLKANRDKCTFFRRKIEYCGVVISKDGFTHSKSKISAILDAPKPTNISQLRSICGLFNYYRRFCPKMAEVIYPLTELLQKDRTWNWQPLHTRAFEEAKRLITNKKMLGHFNPELPLIVTSDASNTGIGGYLAHKDECGYDIPIAYASRTLTKNEKNYSAVDKEGLALVYCVKKFEQYLEGKHFKIFTDHKPLVYMFDSAKGINDSSPRRIRWKLYLTGFDYKIIYKKGSENVIADGLSRLPTMNTESSNLGEMEADVDFIDVSENCLIPISELEKLTREDIEMITLKRVIKDPSLLECENSKHLIRLYLPKLDDISTHEERLYYRNRMIIPVGLQNKVLKLLHIAHLGIEKSKALARLYVWWPTIELDISDFIKNCNYCMKQKLNKPKKAPDHPWIPPQMPMERIHIDFAGPFKGKMFFIIIDAYSKWPEVFVDESFCGKRTVEKLREVMARFGLAKSIVSDNGPQFTSKEFDRFVINNGIRHVRIAPYHPSSNGQVERFVQTLKKALYESREEDLEKSLNQFLMVYRNTPHCTTNNTPASKLLCYKPPNLWTRLSDTTKSEIPQNGLIKGTRNFEINDRVLALNYKKLGETKWENGVVSKKIGNVHYLVKLDIGGVIKKHIDQLRESKMDNALPNGEDSIDFYWSMNDNNDKHTEIEKSTIEKGLPQNSGESAQTLRRSTRIRKPPNAWGA